MSKVLKIGIIAGVLVFLTVFLILSNVQATEEVVFAAKEIPAGTVVTADMLTTKSIPVTAVPPEAVKNINEVVGKRLEITRTKDDFIPRNIVLDKSIKLEPGNVLVSINVPSEDAPLVSAGTKITLVLLKGTGSEEVQYVPDLNIVFLKQFTSPVTGSIETVAYLETTPERAVVIAPYIKSGSYKIIRQ
ncbi:SAF domain-containing protein [Caldanaerobacter subterraneus]|uniref:SAF domain-containing protein n=1 Tax=Caldanaerobacter subterraneus TaxID=911092 RepID=A0A4R2JUE9_9THEO|nr:SAF domain-containing protein [Caldanaerobacter subterraneus]TCO57785.1 SAF domain-containing protein [Caldanaerobacter subterraneus]